MEREGEGTVEGWVKRRVEERVQGRVEEKVKRRGDSLHVLNPQIHLLNIATPAMPQAMLEVHSGSISSVDVDRAALSTESIADSAACVAIMTELKLCELKQLKSD